MDKKAQFIFVIVFIFITGISQTQEKMSDFPVLKGPYLGQKAPGMKPELFAPGIISTGFSEGTPSFTPDGKEFYYTLWGAPHNVILFMKEENGRWSRPQVASFSGQYEAKAYLSPDGNKMIFSTNSPPDGRDEPKLHSIWIVERTNARWRKPIYIGPPVNLGDSVNTELYDIDPYIAYDESYIIFCRIGDGYGGSDLFISFRKEDGSWTKAKNMGSNINSSANEFTHSVTSDGKYFFFTSSRRIHKNYSETPLSYKEKIKILNNPGNGSSDIYWVDAKVIEKLKPDGLK